MAGRRRTGLSGLFILVALVLALWWWSEPSSVPAKAPEKEGAAPAAAGVAERVPEPEPPQAPDSLESSSFEGEDVEPSAAVPTFAGRVVGGKGEPLPGAEVELWVESDRRVVVRGVTDDVGGYAFAVDDVWFGRDVPAPATVRAEMDGFSAGEIEVRIPREGGKAPDLMLELWAEDAASLSAYLVDEADTPIEAPGSYVILSPADAPPSPETWRSGFWDEETGRVRIDSIEPSRAYRLSVHLVQEGRSVEPPVLSDDMLTFLPRQRVEDYPIRVAIRTKSGCIGGTITDDTGMVIYNGHVLIETDGLRATAASDNHGVVELCGIPDALAQVPIRVTEPFHVPLDAVADVGRIDHAFVLERNPRGSVEVTLVDAETGETIDGATVLCHTAHSVELVTENGVALFADLPTSDSSEHQLLARADGYEYDTFRVMLSEPGLVRERREMRPKVPTVDLVFSPHFEGVLQDELLDLYDARRMSVTLIRDGQRQGEGRRQADGFHCALVPDADYGLALSYTLGGSAEYASVRERLLLSDVRVAEGGAGKLDLYLAPGSCTLRVPRAEGMLWTINVRLQQQFDARVEADGCECSGGCSRSWMVRATSDGWFVHPYLPMGGYSIEYLLTNPDGEQQTYEETVQFTSEGQIVDLVLSGT